MVHLQWKLQSKWHYNIGKILEKQKKTQIATVENGYHGDTFGAMSVGYVPEFFGKFKKQLFSTIQFSVPNKYRIPKGFTFLDYQNYCLEKIEKRFSKNDEHRSFHNGKWGTNGRRSHNLSKRLSKERLVNYVKNITSCLC